jgi:hypothetical protein
MLVDYIEVINHIHVTMGGTKLENTKVTQIATSCSYQTDENKLTG